MSKTVKPYQEKGAGKKEQVTNMFDNIAPHYDLLNRVLTLGIDQSWRKKAIHSLLEDNPKVILDVATGTADIAIMIAKELQAKKIVGLDISKEMLEIGQKKIEKKGLQELIRLEQGDSENLSFESNTFDAVTVAFGVRNFENLELGLKEILRVLKPGGKAVILEFSKPSYFPFKQIFNGYFKYILPLIGKLKSKDPAAYRYLYESVQVFPNGKEFVKVLEKTGFKSNQWKSLSLGICAIYIGQK